MKIVLLGATGDTGKPLLRQCLDHNHSVTGIIFQEHVKNKKNPHFKLDRVFFLFHQKCQEGVQNLRKQ